MTDNSNRHSGQKDNSVYLISIAVTLAVVAWGYWAPENFGVFANALFTGLTKYFGWGYLLTMNVFVLWQRCYTLARILLLAIRKKNLG